MANPYSGESAIRIDGKDHIAKLTLGALAGLEADLGVDCLMDMVKRFETGQFSSRDVLFVLIAGLRGGGWKGAIDDLISAEICDGPLSAAQAAAELLARAFHIPAR